MAQAKSYSPADDAGLRKGDIIEAIDGNRINNPSQISSQIHKKHVSDQISITVNRYGTRFKIPLQLHARP